VCERSAKPVYANARPAGWLALDIDRIAQQQGCGIGLAIR
jgi:hypothetical protein